MGVQLRLLQLSLLSGFFLSAYVEMIKIEFEKNPDYVPQCDISEEVSCSKVLHSEYGHMLSALKLIDKDSLLNQTNAFYGKVHGIASASFRAILNPKSFAHTVCRCYLLY